MKHLIHPARDLHDALLSVEKPGRYVGGEFGSHVPDLDAPLRIALCFPDLYEIGMANHAIKILYHLLERIDGVSCERVFAVPPDFEDELTARSIPLYSLESGTPLCDFDIVAFSVGYELAATTVLSVLELGGIPLLGKDRGQGDPLVIAGGPAMTNPAPFGRFIDAVYIGEAEEDLPGLIANLAQLKRRGAARSELLEQFVSHRAVWSTVNPHPVVATRFSRFGLAPFHASLPVPGLRTVQDHGAVEIMRGCPNGCRFCHAGILYRPNREKSFAVILEEVEYLVSVCGYREITISSLSTGDYSDVFALVQKLNSVYSARGISFSLPSIRIDSFTLSLLEQVSAVRKSGLTFAVETPLPQWQRGINKEVPLEKTLSVMLEAKRQGWKLAKFYFMLGLPVTGGVDETPAIAEFLETIQKKTGMSLNVNVSTFVPKPHTPFQWAAQLDETESNRRIQWLKNEMRRKPITIRYNAPFASVIEGIICRGDESTGGIVLAAYEKGSRLDAWEDYFKRETWREALADAPGDPEAEGLAERATDAALPWDRVSLGVRKSVLKRENERSREGVLTGPCEESCKAYCGVCSRDLKVRRVIDPVAPVTSPVESEPLAAGISPGGVRMPVYVVDVRFQKQGRAAYLSHLDTLRLFSRAFARAGFRMKFTEGFNPKPKLEFAHPISLGFTSDEEIARILLEESPNPGELIRKVNNALHDGFVIIDVKIYKKPDTRIPSLMSLYWGSEYMLSVPDSLGIGGSELGAMLTEELDHRGAGAHVTVLGIEERSITFRLESAGKQTNLRKILSVFEERSSELRSIRVRRLRTLRSGPSGSEFSVYF